MKMKIHTDVTQENLIHRLCEPAVMRYLGRTACLRLEVLAAVESGAPSLYAIAKEYRVSPQAVYKIAKRARAIPKHQPPVD